MRYVNCLALSGVDSGSVTGSQIDSNQLITVSFQVVFGDATANGTVQIQGSNDIDTSSHTPMPFVATNWSNVQDAHGTATVIDGATTLVFLPNIAYRWIRVIYTSSSGGSTTVVANMFAMSI